MCIDSGCPQTMAGQEFLIDYTEINKLKMGDLKTEEVDKNFVFGETEYHCIKSVLLPVKLPVTSKKSTPCLLMEVNVIDGPIPFLFGKNHGLNTGANYATIQVQLRWTYLLVQTDGKQCQ